MENNFNNYYKNLGPDLDDVNWLKEKNDRWNKVLKILKQKPQNSLALAGQKNYNPEKYYQIWDLIIKIPSTNARLQEYKFQAAEHITELIYNNNIEEAVSEVNKLAKEEVQSTSKGLTIYTKDLPQSQNYKDIINNINKFSDNNY